MDINAQRGKVAYEDPVVEVLGTMQELTGSGGADNDDGWGYDNCA